MRTVESAIVPSGGAERKSSGTGRSGGEGGLARTSGGGVAASYEDAFALARLERAASDELVVGGLHRVLGETELALERAHRRQAAARGEPARFQLGEHGAHHVFGREAPAGSGGVHRHAEIRGSHQRKNSRPRRQAKGQSPIRRWDKR